MHTFKYALKHMNMTILWCSEMLKFEFWLILSVSQIFVINLYHIGFWNEWQHIQHIHDILIFVPIFSILSKWMNVAKESPGSPLAPPAAAATNHSCCAGACFLLLFFLSFVLFFQFLILIFHFPTFFVIMTSHCFNFRFAYPLPLLPYLHTTRMASGHPTDKFSFMYQPDTHKRYETRKHAPSRSHAAPPPLPPSPAARLLKEQVSGNNRGTEASTGPGS